MWFCFVFFFFLVGKGFYFVWFWGAILGTEFKALDLLGQVFYHLSDTASPTFVFAAADQI
jgi:hypothetical protein